MKEKIIKELQKYGDIEIWSEDHSFSFLMTGTGLEDTKTFLRIGKLVAEYAEIKGYSTPEVIKNSDTFICIILKP